MTWARHWRPSGEGSSWSNPKATLWSASAMNAGRSRRDTSRWIFCTSKKRPKKKHRKIRKVNWKRKWQECGDIIDRCDVGFKIGWWVKLGAACCYIDFHGQAWMQSRFGAIWARMERWKLRSWTTEWSVRLKAMRARTWDFTATREQNIYQSDVGTCSQLQKGMFSFHEGQISDSGTPPFFPFTGDPSRVSAIPDIILPLWSLQSSMET